jgi:putative peptidoglycan lipid II flippase
MMVRFFSAIGREVRGMHEAAYLLAAFALGSQLLALLRDRILAASFGASHTLDLYYAAFRIPDFIFATIASLLSLYALLPVLSRLERQQEGLVISFLRDTLVVFFAAMAVVCGIAALVAPDLVFVVAPGLAHDAYSRAQLILLARILLLQPILLGASNTLASYTQLRNRFVLYSISPLLYNIGIIFGAIVLYPHFGIAGLGWGVVFGALMHVAIQIPFFFSEKSAVRIPFTAPRTLALAAGQISLLAIVALASYLVPGSIAVFTFAYNLQAVPLTIIGVSYSVAAFPTLARLYAAGEHTQFVHNIEAALRHIIFWAIPATIFVIVLRAQLVRSILGAGQFDWSATRLTAAALALFILSLAAQSASLLIARAYYAAGNTKKPLYFGILDVCVSVGGAIVLVTLFEHYEFVHYFIEALLRVTDIPGTAVLMLALGYACGSIAEFAVSYIFFMRDFTIPRARLQSLAFQSFCASVLGGGVSYLVLVLLGFIITIQTTIGVFLEGLCAGVCGLLTTAAVLWLLKNQELAEAVEAFKRYFKDVPAVALEASEISS